MFSSGEFVTGVRSLRDVDSRLEEEENSSCLGRARGTAQITIKLSKIAATSLCRVPHS